MFQRSLKKEECMNKKLIGLALFLTLATTLGACQPGGSGGGEATPASPSPAAT
jgi:hypothetical protein